MMFVVNVVLYSIKNIEDMISSYRNYHKEKKMIENLCDVCEHRDCCCDLKKVEAIVSDDKVIHCNSFVNTLKPKLKYKEY